MGMQAKICKWHRLPLAFAPQPAAAGTPAALRAMAGKGHWVSGLLGKLPVLPPFLAAAESFNAGALLLTTAPLWAPIILLALLSLGAAVPRSAARLLRSGQRSGVLTGILGPWAARRVLRALRVLLGGARAAAPQQAAAGLRRSLASSLSLAGSTTETGFAGYARPRARRRPPHSRDDAPPPAA